jgi:chemotaxis protein MotA
MAARLGKLLGWLAIGAAVWWAYRRSGVALGGFLQWQALAMVGGGTAVALLVSYPWRLVLQAGGAVRRAWQPPPESPAALIPVFAEWASRAKRSGIMAVEREIRRTDDPFLARALTLAVSGVDGTIVRQTLDVDHRVTLEREEEEAQVLEAAGGYAPTLGIIAAVLGLIRVMEDLSSPAGVGAGIAAAFVATLYGLGAANLVFLPLATRLRSRSRQQALRREFTIDGVLALHGGLHPRLVEERLNGYITPGGRDMEVA